MTRYGWAGAVALSFALAGCSHPAKSAASSTPSAESFRAERLEVRTGGTVEQVKGAAVTSVFFREANLPPLVGRLFLDQEYQTTGAPVVVIADSYWQRRFGGDPAVIGRKLLVNQEQRKVVGILPKDFHPPAGAEIWIPQSQ